VPANRITMRRIREVLRLKHECGLPNARIAAALGIAKGSVANYLTTRCQRRILPIVSTQITPDRSANCGVCQAAHFYVIKQPQTCTVLRENSHSSV